MAYTPPAPTVVNFALSAFTREVLVGATAALSAHAPPGPAAVNFVLSVFAPPSFPSVDFELGSAAHVYYGVLKRWTGSFWTKAKLMAWTGAAWAEKKLNRWDGSAWVEVDSTGA